MELVDKSLFFEKIFFSFFFIKNLLRSPGGKGLFGRVGTFFCGLSLCCYTNKWFVPPTVEDNQKAQKQHLCNTSSEELLIHNTRTPQKANKPLPLVRKTIYLVSIASSKSFGCLLLLEVTPKFQEIS